MTKLLNLLKKEVDKLQTRVQQEKRRKERQLVEALPENELEPVERSPLKKRRIVLDDSD